MIPNVTFEAEQLVGALVRTIFIRSTLSQAQLISTEEVRTTGVQNAIECFLRAFKERSISELEADVV